MQTNLEIQMFLELGRLNLNPWPLLTYLKKECVSGSRRVLGLGSLTLATSGLRGGGPHPS